MAVALQLYFSRTATPPPEKAKAKAKAIEGEGGAVAKKGGRRNKTRKAD